MRSVERETKESWMSGEDGMQNNVIIEIRKEVGSRRGRGREVMRKRTYNRRRGVKRTMSRGNNKDNKKEHAIKENQINGEAKGERGKVKS